MIESRVGPRERGRLPPFLHSSIAMLAVLRDNPRFRRLWSAQVVSQLGDWLNRVAVLTLIGSIAGEEAHMGFGLLLAFEMALRLLPSTVLGSIAGPVADRLPRRALMVAADLLRIAVVLSLLLVRGPEQLPLLYVLLFAQMAVSIFFEAARGAAMPGTVRKEDLRAAYTLVATTWSMMLTIGAIFGGLLVEIVGIRGVFILDAITYGVSAVLLVGLRLDPVPAHPKPFEWRDLVLLRDMRKGLAHVRELGLTPVVFAKAAWGVAGGFLVAISVAGRIRFPDIEVPGLVRSAATGGLAIGLLYAARGVGTAVGPILSRRFFDGSDASLRRQISAGFFIGATGYFFFGRIETFGLAALFVCLAHTGGSNLWVSSSTFWQRHVGDAFRGRVYAMELMGMTLATTLGGLLAGIVYDATLSIEAMVTTTSATVIVSGCVWTFLARRIDVDREPPSDASPPPAEKPTQGVD